MFSFEDLLSRKPNGDIYLGRVRIYNGFRRAPVRWVMCIAAIGATAAWIGISVIFLGGFGH